MEGGGGRGEREPLPAAGGREGRRVSGKGKAGCGVEPQVGEERVFPVSHEVITLVCPLALPLGRYLEQAAAPKGCPGNSKWGVLESSAGEGRVGSSLKLQDFGVRRPELESDLGRVEDTLLGTSLDLPPALRFPLPVPHSASARSSRLPLAKPTANTQPSPPRSCFLGLWLPPLTPCASQFSCRFCRM